MEASDLETAGVRFFAIFDADTPVAMGALKALSGPHGEVKSMHVVAEHRGRGYADALLKRLLTEARAAGMQRVSLETGSQPVFAAARAFYARHGFAFCDPFEGYGPDPNSVFMAKDL